MAPSLEQYSMTSYPLLPVCLFYSMVFSKSYSELSEEARRVIVAVVVYYLYMYVFDFLYCSPLSPWLVL